MTMFGYIYVNRKELSEEDRNDNQSYYCGLCQVLKKSSGVKLLTIACTI